VIPRCKIFLSLTFALLAIGSSTLKTRAQSTFQNPRLQKEKLTVSQALDSITANMEADNFPGVQDWILRTELINADANNDDSINYYIKSKQTELYYFTGLPLLALQVCAEAISLAAKQNNNNFLADAYGYKAYILESLDSIPQAIIACRTSLKYFPKIAPTGYRVLITEAQMINQLSQLYLLNKQGDSALYYNNIGLKAARQGTLQRPIAICLATNGFAYNLLDNKDSALAYFNAAYAIAEKNNKSDLQLWVLQGKLKYANPSYEAAIFEGLKLIEAKKINNIYSKQYLQEALKLAGTIGNTQLKANIQSKLIDIEAANNKFNGYISQLLAVKQMTNQQDIVKLQIDKYKSAQMITVFKVMAIVLIAFLALAVFIFLARRKRDQLQQELVLQQNIFDERITLGKELQAELGDIIDRMHTSTQTLKSLSTNPSTVNDLTNIEMLGHAAIEKTNDVIWSLNINNNSWQSLRTYLKQHIEALKETTVVSIAYHATEVDFILSPLQIKFVVQFVKEHLQQLVYVQACPTIDVNLMADSSTIKIHLLVPYKYLSMSNGSNKLFVYWRNKAADLSGTLELASTADVSTTLNATLPR
jgi:type II secretory pathway pseudopilin PulG